MISNLSQIQIAGLIACLAATPFIIASIRNLMLSKASKHWPKVDGVIKGISDFGSEIKFKMTYEYVVNRNTYQSSRIIFSTSSTYHKYYAREFEVKYTQNQTVDVFYNPKNPKQAVLEAGRNSSSVSNIVLLIVFIVFSAVAIFKQDLLAPYLH